MLRADAPLFVPSTPFVALTADQRSQASATSTDIVVKTPSAKAKQRDRPQRNRRRAPPIPKATVVDRELPSDNPSTPVHQDSSVSTKKSRTSRRRTEPPLNHGGKKKNNRRSARDKGSNHSKQGNGDHHPEDERGCDALQNSFPALTQTQMNHSAEKSKESSLSRKESPVVVAPTTGWSAVAVRCHEKSQEQNVRDPITEDLTSASGFGRLTLLKSTVRKLTDHHQNEPGNDSVLQRTDSARLDAKEAVRPFKTTATSDDDRVTKPTSLSRISSRSGNSNMDKLRDRWWDVLHQKMARDAAEETKKKLLELRLKEKLEREAAMRAQVTSSFVPAEVCNQDEDHQSNASSDDEEEQEHQNILETYANAQFPLHMAVMNGDEQALPALLSNWHDDEGESSLATRRQLNMSENDKERSSVMSFTPLHLAVYLDKPLFVSLLLQSGKPSLSVAAVDGNNMVTPLMLGSELGRDGCLAILLSQGALVSARDARGNNALHYCCRAGAPVSTLKTLLGSRQAAGNGQLYKLLASRNEETLQTPLHLACTLGRNHLVEALLNFLPGSAMARLLALTDHLQQTPLLAAIKAGRTDVVMSLLMWSGNRTAGGDLGPFSYSKARWSSLNGETAGGTATNNKAVQCPLVAAVQSESTDMVQILLEFHNSSDSIYNLTDALHAALSLSSEDCMLEMIQVLIEAGANAFRVVPPSDSISATSGTGVTALTLAMRLGDVNILATLVDAAIRQLERKRQSRRQDPRLQKQPESFFCAIQGKEDSEMDLAMSEALISSLYSAWDTGDVSSAALTSSLLLFRRNARLDMSWLRHCFAAKSLIPRVDVPRVVRKQVYTASYQHDAGPNAFQSRKMLDYWSRELYSLPWMVNSIKTQCSWFKWIMAQCPDPKCEATSSRSDCILRIATGESFLVHEAIVSEKSGKLAAAIRFAKMKQKDDRLVEVHLDISGKLCRRMLEHVYHGSIINNSSQSCQDVLELMLVAEEFLCPSLMQECEMRLLSSDPTQCFCWNCCSVVRPLDRGSNKSGAKCEYFVKGPPRLIDVNNALDCLAVSQQLSSCNVEFLINFWRESVEGNIPATSSASEFARNTYERSEYEVTNPMALAGDLAAACLLKGFHDVLQQKPNAIDNQAAVDEAFDWRDQQSRNATLLAVCLDELACSPLVKVMSQAQSKRSAAWTKRTKD